ncbi:MAG: DegV family protein, partial [Clostridia bacterium]|nr:DegV family protein [Clostridia bacterium]
MIRILVDSASDITKAEAQAKNFDFVSLNVHFEDKSYRDGDDIEYDEFYEMLIKSESFPKTSQPSPETYLAIYNDAKEKGDEVIVLTLSSGISGTYQSATIAKDLAEYDKIHVIDSLSAVAGVRILADHATQLIKEGLSVTEIVEKIEALKSRITIFIATDTLEYLFKGGRLSRASATIGELAKLKPIITVSNEDGTLKVVKKCIGRNKSISTIASTCKECNPDTDYPVYPIYAYNADNCEKLESKLAAEGVKYSERKPIGSTIGAHVGPGTYGVVFIKK